MKNYLLNVIRIVALVSVLILTIIFNNQFNRGIFLQILGVFIGIIGGIFWITGKMALGKYYSTSFTPKDLVTKGIYSKIRHPMYYGGIFIYLGIGLLFKSLIGLALTLIFIIPLLIYSIIKEEKLLIKKYGERYIEYKKKTIF